MKTLGKLKLLAVAALMLVGMSACLKSNGPSFTIGVMAYVQQYGSGDNAVFKPAIQVQGNEPLHQVSAKYNNQTTLIFQPIKNTENYAMELAYAPASDTIPNGTYTVTASNMENEVTAQQFTFNVDKKLGKIELSEFAYNGTTGKITAKWNKTENAVSYYVMYKTTTEMWIPYGMLNDLDVNGDVVSAEFSLPLKKDEEYTVSVAAFYKSLLTVATPVRIVGGTDTSLNAGTGEE